MGRKRRGKQKVRIIYYFKLIYFLCEEILQNHDEINKSIETRKRGEGVGQRKGREKEMSQNYRDPLRRRGKVRVKVGSNVELKRMGK